VNVHSVWVLVFTEGNAASLVNSFDLNHNFVDSKVVELVKERVVGFSLLSLTLLLALTPLIRVITITTIVLLRSELSQSPRIDLALINHLYRPIVVILRNSATTW
jgi:energy-converting hydrogenase Eha subunit E